MKPVQYGLDEESHLPNVISISDSPIFKYSNEKLEDYNSVFKYDALRNPSKKDKNYWFNVEHKESKIKGVRVGFDNPAFIPSAIGWNIGRLISKKCLFLLFGKNLRSHSICHSSIYCIKNQQSL